ncbi:mechanosensitive ion channel family protein [Polaribacter sp. Hel1_85]|uniref:mechanosensitive ion channel family protein n=1 Tax=Polaribacter sp. Hel1_85 TaxID=1250005 RepID=UPI00052D93E0|nr:mechanosensitive ion channel domain-containing protein [Polaribacter sp. Hel1_85]KGL64293.1 potassium efflux system KefA protein / small-conductance mechanosensitive channel [Polaribacter sp. Hel1_85]
MIINEIKTPINLESWITYSLVILGCILLGLGIRWVLFSILKFSNNKKPAVLKVQLLKHLKTPAKFLLPILFIYSSLGLFELNSFWYKVIEALIIINISWIVIASLNATEEIIKQKFSIDNTHKAKDRKVLTQLRFIKSLSIIIIITLAIATILWNIPAVKKLGTTILTSAGVIGIIVGVAAQKSIANLITGFQIAFTQPIKIDDEVVIEGEFGTVENITLTYVVIKIWDKRRLVLPLSYFNDKPFINWTFNSTDLIGTVFLYVDYTFPVKVLRKKLLEILNNNPLWDKKTANLLVTNTDARSMELRAAFSAKNASDAWNMRCEIREQLIEFIKEKHPTCLPKLRGFEKLKK